MMLVVLYSLANNYLTGNGSNMSGITALTNVLKDTQITDLK